VRIQEKQRGRIRCFDHVVFSGLWPFSKRSAGSDETADLEGILSDVVAGHGFDIHLISGPRHDHVGMEFMADVPFRQVHIHGLVRDAERQKDLSKDQGQHAIP